MAGEEAKDSVAGTVPGTGGGGREAGKRGEAIRPGERNDRWRCWQLKMMFWLFNLHCTVDMMVIWTE